MICLKSEVIYISILFLFCYLYEFLLILSQVYLHGRDKVNMSYMNECEGTSSESLPHYLLRVSHSHWYADFIISFCNTFDRKIMIAYSSN